MEKKMIQTLMITLLISALNVASASAAPTHCLARTYVSALNADFIGYELECDDGTVEDILPARFHSESKASLDERLKKRITDLSMQQVASFGKSFVYCRPANETIDPAKKYYLVLKFNNKQSRIVEEDGDARITTDEKPLSYYAQKFNMKQEAFYTHMGYGATTAAVYRDLP